MQTPGYEEGGPRARLPPQVPLVSAGLQLGAGGQRWRVTGRVRCAQEVQVPGNWLFLIRDTLVGSSETPPASPLEVSPLQVLPGQSIPTGRCLQPN